MAERGIFKNKKKRSMIETIATERTTSVLGLVKHLRDEIKTLLRQEIDLAKAEMSEKISLMGRNAASLAIGGFIAYAGLIVLLAGLGVLIAYAFESTGMDRALAGFLGLAIMGLVVMLVGGDFIFKALKTLWKQSLAPKRTIHTIQELRT